MCSFRGVMDSYRIVSVDGFYDGVALAFEDAGEHAPYAAVVLHDENGLGTPFCF